MSSANCRISVTGKSPCTATHIMGWALTSYLLMVGASVSSGKSCTARDTTSRTSWAALSILRYNSNSMVMRDEPRRFEAEMCLTPSSWPIRPSIILVMLVSICSGVELVQLVETVTMGYWTSGMSAMPSRMKPMTPKIRKAQMTMTVVTGLFMEVSDSHIIILCNFKE